MAAIGAFCRHMEHVSGISHVASNPVFNSLAKSASNLRFVAKPIGVAEVHKPIAGPIAHRHHHIFLIHFETTGLVEMQQSFPRVSETVRPLAGVTVLLVPHVFFGPQPPLLPQRQDQFENVGIRLRRVP